MRKPKKQKFELFRWLNVPYRLVIIDEQSLDEVASYKLKKMTLYMILSTLVLVTMLGTVLLVVATPLKYYLPGYGSNEDRKAMIEMKYKLDSLDATLASNERHYDRLVAVLQGEFTGVRDTNLIDMERLRNEKLKSYFPEVDSIKEDANELLKMDQDSTKKTEPIKKASKENETAIPEAKK